MKTNEAPEIAVLHTLRRFTEAYARKDVEGVVRSFISDGATLVVIGADNRKVITGAAELRCQLKWEFAEWNDLSLDLTWASIAVRGNFAWIATIGSVTSVLDQEHRPLQSRFTGILIHENENWLLTHVHFSFPIQNVRLPATALE